MALKFLLTFIVILAFTLIISLGITLGDEKPPKSLIDLYALSAVGVIISLIFLIWGF